MSRDPHSLEGFSALTTDVVCLASPPRDGLVLTGADRQRFLHGLVTCEVQGLAAGDGAYGFVTTVKGKIQADLVIGHRGEDLLLSLPAGLGGAIAEHLGKYIIADRVEIAPFAGSSVTLAGAQCLAWLEEHSGESDLAAVAPWGGRHLAIAGVGLWAQRGEHVGVPAWSLWAPEGELPAGLPSVVSSAAEDALRVDRGLPRFGRDFGSDHFPQETGFDDAVSYTKGCYLGQEVIARIHYRGGVQRQIRRLTAPAGGLVGGQKLALEGRPVATVGTVSAAGTAALAMVHRKAWDEGAVLTGDGVEARVDARA